MLGLVPYKRSQPNLVRGYDVWNFERLVDRFFNDSFVGVSTSNIKTDVKETEDAYIIDAELPGFEKGDINIEVKDDVLTINVEKKEEVNEEKDNYIRKERKYGSFKRSFYVENVNSDDIKANYKNGILSVNLPKVEPQQPESKKIEIQ